MEKNLLLFPVLWLMAVPPAPAQDPVVYEVSGDNPADLFGWSIAVLNDIDGDAFPDFVAGALELMGRQDPRGYIRLISGKTGEVLHTWRGAYAGEHLGFSLTAMGDLDGDRMTDFAAAGDPDRVHFISAAKRSNLGTQFLRLPFDRSHRALNSRLAAADVDGDGLQDLVYTDSGHCGEDERGAEVFNAGRVSVYSGAEPRAFWHLVGSVEDGALGRSVAAIGDVDGDGRPDLAVGEPMGHIISESLGPGRVHVLRGLDGATLRVIDEHPGFYFGDMLANFGDLDGDGAPELAVAATGYTESRGRNQGWVGVYSTKTLKLLYEFTGLEGALNLGFKGDALGYRLGLAGDVDLDRVPDFLIGAYRVGEGIGPDYGRLDLRSGKTGALLASYEEGQWDQPWIGALSPLGDVDGDGRPEFILGSPNVPTAPVPRIQYGKVQVIRFEPEEPRFIRGDANGDGRVDLSDAVAMVRKVYFDLDEDRCFKAYDFDGDGVIKVNDFVFLIIYLFLGGLSPSPPFPECGRFGGLRVNPLECPSSYCTSGR